MRFLRSAAGEIIGLFVADWTQTITSIVILALAWLALSRLHILGLAFALGVALALQLIVATAAEARRTKQKATSQP